MPKWTRLTYDDDDDWDILVLLTLRILRILYQRKAVGKNEGMGFKILWVMTNHVS